VSAAWVTAATALAVAACGGAAYCLRWAWRATRRVSHFLDDYSGQPARDGLPERPGFMARLASVEKSLEHVVQETSPNHDKSLRDIVIRTAADVTDIKDEQVRVRADLAALQRERTDGG
jgi:hypothetical protein